jgi:hypothetical protein
MGRVIDALIAYRLLKLLVTPFKKTKAYQMGIIDDKGKVLIKAKQFKDKIPANKRAEAKKSYTLLIRFVFNLKRILSKVGIRGALGSAAAAAIALLKETYGQSDVYEKEIYRYLKNEGYKFDTISESATLNEPISAGSYKVLNDIHDIEGDVIVQSGSTINIKEDIEVFDTILGYEVYPVEVKGTSLYITSEDIRSA